WAPVQESFLETERFGRIVFGDGNLRSARLLRVNPIVIGANDITLDSWPGLRFEVDEIDARSQGPFQYRGAASQTGVCSFIMKSDEVRDIAVTLRDPEGGVLAACRYPMESPRISARVAALERQFDEVVAGLSRFPH